ncbi:MAG: hypothetical protein H0Z24_05970 [Thermosipho sp. (in: Bacteria)]|nr:hypothetical protein [Thermosipho sp. (in: thermotogales)]
MYQEKLNPKFKGEVTDVLINTKTGEKKVLWTSKNVVVDDFSKLIAALVKNESGYSGALYWAVGSGSDSWDDSNPPLPSVTDTKLTSETYRKAITADDMAFLDDNGNETATITNKLQIKVTFTETEANGALREFGIFGGNATSTKDSGIMINHKIHPLIYKTSDMILERTIRFTF